MLLWVVSLYLPPHMVQKYSIFIIILLSDVWIIHHLVNPAMWCFGSDGGVMAIDKGCCDVLMSSRGSMAHL